MINKPIRILNKEELISLVQSKLSDIDKIESFLAQIQKATSGIEDSESKILGDNGYLVQIQKANLEIQEKFEEVNDIFNQICTDSDENISINSLITAIHEDITDKKKKIDTFHNWLFGYIQKIEGQPDEQIEGFEEKIKNLYKTNKDKYEELLLDIETRLEGGATTLELAKTFSDKVTEYKVEGDKWSRYFLYIGFFLIIYFIIITWNTKDATSFGHVWTLILYRLPLMGFAIWVIGFISNRRAEAKKLEESYKHKETLARSYVGYRKSIEELSDDDTDLLKSHMSNLLLAINKDSSDFLIAKGESHPFEGAFQRFNSIPENSKVG